MLTLPMFCFAVDGGYGPWGDFGECTVTCGGGVRQKERLCNNPEPKRLGKTCEEQELGPGIETESCNPDPCPGNFILILLKTILKRQQ